MTSPRPGPRLPSPRLASPTTAVRTSYIDGEGADMVHRGVDATWLDAAREDFSPFVDARVLLTVAADNAASQLVIKRNGGVADGVNRDGELRLWIDVPPDSSRDEPRP